MRGKETQHALNVFVCHRPEDDVPVNGTVAVELQRFQQRGNAAGIVGNIHDDGRLKPYGLYPCPEGAPPTYVPNTFCEGFITDGKLVGEELSDCQRDGKIPLLVLSGQRQHQFGAVGQANMLLELRGCGYQLEIRLWYDDSAGTTLLRPPTEELSDVRAHFADDGRAPRFDDSNLLPGDILQRSAQVVLVVVVYARNNGDERLYNVRSIVAPSHADFNNGNVHCVAGKQRKCQGCGDLKERSANSIGFAQEPWQELYKRAIINRSATDLDALVETAEVRRRVQSDAVALRVECGRYQGTDAAFPVRTGDVDYGIAPVWVAEKPQEVLYAFQSRSDAEAVALEELVQQCSGIHQYPSEAQESLQSLRN